MFSFEWGNPIADPMVSGPASWRRRTGAGRERPEEGGNARPPARTLGLPRGDA